MMIGMLWLLMIGMLWRRMMMIGMLWLMKAGTDRTKRARGATLRATIVLQRHIARISLVSPSLALACSVAHS